MQSQVTNAPFQTTTDLEYREFFFGIIHYTPVQKSLPCAACQAARVRILSFLVTQMTLYYYIHMVFC